MTPTYSNSQLVHFQGLFEATGWPIPLPILWQAVEVAVWSMVPSRSQNSISEHNTPPSEKMTQKGAFEGMLQPR